MPPRRSCRSAKGSEPMSSSRSRFGTPGFRLFTLVLSVLSVAAISAAQQGHSIEEYAKSVLGAHQYRQVATSPDGSRIAWVERQQDEKGAPSRYSAIWVTGADSSTSIRRISAASGDHVEHSPVWSPDSQEIAFLSDAAGRASFNSTWRTRVMAGRASSPTQRVSWITINTKR